jgi:lipopolysaccharide export system protein LptA
VLLGFVSSGFTADKPRSGFTIPYYEDRTLLKAIFTGLSGQAIPGGAVFATNFTATTVLEGRRDQPEFSVSAPWVLFNQAQRTASSAGPVRFATADGNFLLTGDGFLWQQTERLLFISNNVATTLVDPKKPGAAPVTIRSERLRYDRDARSGAYEGTVRVVSPEFTLDGGELTVAMTVSNTLERLTARRDVVFADLLEKSTATADFADYQILEGREYIELDGKPRWRDAFRRSRAAHYSIDRAARTLLATGDAYFRLPRESLSQPGGVMAGTPTIQSATNFVELTASRIFAALDPATNQVRHILAETNVVIASTDGRDRSSGDRAEYLEATGDLVLTGHRAEVRRDDSVVQARHIRVNRVSGDVEATTNAFLRIRLPITAERSRSLSVSTNLFAEVDASAFRIQGGQVVADDQVKARLLEDGALAGTLDSRQLKAAFDADKNVRHIDALGQVFIRQFPVNGRTNFLGKELTAEHLVADVSVDHSLQKLEADQGLRVEQRVVGSKGATNVTIAGARTASAWFGSLSTLERFVAQQQVHLSRDADYVTGERAVYQATNRVGVLELTGNPLAVKDGAMITNADSLLYHEETKKVSAYGRFNVVPVTTNTVAKPNAGQ